jgi:hypothetical protein
MKPMKKITAFLIFFLFAGLQVPVFSHAPSDIKADFDAKTKRLSITVTHQTSAPIMHYIKHISVKLNNADIKDFYFTKQSSAANEKATLFINKAVKKGDQIQIFAVCNLSGSKTVRITL